MKTDIELEPHASTYQRPRLGLGIALIDDDEERLVLDVVRAARPFRYAYDLPPENQGPMARTLELEVASSMKVKFALGVTSGTAALEVALGALGVGPGDEVIVPAWSWVSCFTAIVRMGAQPILAEIDDTLCLAKGEISRLRTPRTKAALVVHYQGAAADMDELLREAKEAGIAVLEDCAEAIGASFKGRPVGSMGDIAIYSFQAQKVITSGEGGMVVTNSPELYERAVRMHDLGLYRPYHSLQHVPKLSSFAGGQYRMNELTAAMALAQFRKLPRIRTHCRRIFKIVSDGISGLSQLNLRRIADPDGNLGIELYFYLPQADQALAFSQRLHELGVNSAKMTGTYCQYEREYCVNRASHNQNASPFKDFAQWPAKGYRAQDFPVTEDLVHRFVSLPFGVLYTDQDASHIVEMVQKVYFELGLNQG